MAMMGIKTGTKAYSDAPQNQIAKIDKTQNVSATDMSKLEGQDVGELLNKIADPNWVDPNKKMRAVGNDKLDKEAFMKLMLAQMKNQDPMNPMQSHELAAQLAQFSSVEQLSNVNSTLEGMAKGQKPQEAFQALNFIGKAVSGDSSKLVRAKGDKEHDFSFSIMEDAKSAKIKVRNAAGEVVRTVDLKELKKGENTWRWNGLDERGMASPSGEYQIFAEAEAANGKKLVVKTDFSGVISGVNYTPEGPVLLVGTQSVKIKDVKKIVDAGLMNNGQNIQKQVHQDLKGQQPAAQNETKAQNIPGAGDPVLAGPSNIMDNVEMSNEMLARLSKETAPDKGKQ